MPGTIHKSKGRPTKAKQNNVKLCQARIQIIGTNEIQLLNNLFTFLKKYM